MSVSLESEKAEGETRNEIKEIIQLVAMKEHGKNMKKGFKLHQE